nr:CYP71D1-like protein [Aquilaria sinensis]
MEQQFFSSPALFTFLAFLFVLVKIWSHSKTRPNLPPGPRKLPLIGNLHQLKGLPHHDLRDMAAKFGPLTHLQLGELSTILVSSPEIAEQVMKVHDVNFANRPDSLTTRVIGYNHNDIAFAPYGEYWRQMKKLCTVELLSAKRVQLFRSIREEEVSNLTKAIAAQAGSQINLSRKLFSLMYQVTSRAAIGSEGRQEEKFKRATQIISDMSSGFSICDVFPSVKMLTWITGRKAAVDKTFKAADSILEDIVNEHIAEREAAKCELEDDLVHVFLSIKDRGALEFPFTRTNIKAVILQVLLGGAETSSTATEWVMSEMLRNPNVLEKAQAEVRQVVGTKGAVDEDDIKELNYLKSVIKETLRLHPPLPLLLFRTNTDKCEISGYDIPAKTQVIVNAWAIGRDPKRWTDPETFNPGRFECNSLDFRGMDFSFIPFGAGRRICPGIAFGVANVELPLANLLYHFDWALPDGQKYQDLDMTESFGASVRRKSDLLLVPNIT